jgi:hypothetical protein
MQITDDIQVIQGSLGSGKSMVAMCECIYQLNRGGVIATNFTLTPHWAYDLAGQSIYVKIGIKDRYEKACCLFKRAFKIGNPQSMAELSGDRGENLNRLCVGKAKNKREGKGLLIIDDCHHFFNSRTFTANKEYVSFFANARKYGWRTILITHDVDNIDKQIRSYIEIEARFRNLQKVRIPFIGIPLSPFFPMFLIRRKYYGLGPGSGSNHSLDIYPFDIRAARLYDTLERFTSDDVLASYRHQGLHPKEYAKCQSNTRNKTYTEIAKYRAAEPFPRYHDIIRP